MSCPFYRVHSFTLHPSPFTLLARHEADHACQGPPPRPQQQPSSWTNYFPSLQSAPKPQNTTPRPATSSSPRPVSSTQQPADRKQLERLFFMPPPPPKLCTMLKVYLCIQNRERLDRQKQKSSAPSTAVATGGNQHSDSLQTDLTEDEQLAIALQNSLDEEVSALTFPCFAAPSNSFFYCGQNKRQQQPQQPQTHQQEESSCVIS